MFRALDLTAASGRRLPRIECLRRPVSVFGPEFETLQRDELARRIGALLYREASVISAETVDAVAAVMVRLESLHDTLLDLLAEEFGRASMTEMAEAHLLGLTKAQATD